MSAEDILMKAKHTAIIEDFVEKMRPPEEIRPELDIGYRYEKWTLEVGEIRPPWNDMKSGKKLWIPAAKAKYVKSRKIWRLYWMRASGKWEYLTPLGEQTDLVKVLELIKENPNGFFFG